MVDVTTTRGGQTINTVVVNQAIPLVGHESDLVRQANDTVFGLAAGIWTNDYKRAIRVARKIKAGVIWINTFRAMAVNMPFGGTKASGYGRFGGKAGIAEFTELRWITIETGPQHYPI